jgi:predicted signal transduction protein with EAL and GGDEF domain
MRESLIEAVPDLVAFIGSDGTVLDHLGGSRAFPTGGSGALTGRRLDGIWPDEAVARAIRQLIRGVFATREPAEARFRDGGRSLEIRVRPHGRKRALLVVRDAGAPDPANLRDSADAAAMTARRIERRGFLKRFQLSIADASLRSRPLAVCMIHLGGLQAIGQAFGFQVAERVSTLALDRLRESAAASGDAAWHVGQLGEGLLAGVIDDVLEPGSVRALAAGWCQALGEELRLGDATFTLSPHAGVAFLGPDANRPQILLEHARAAMLEARRSGATEVRCYSETMRLRPLAGLDREAELREAIESGHLHVAYAVRRALESGRLAAVEAEPRLRLPGRGELRGPQFLPLAQHSGLLQTIGRLVVERVLQDLPGLLPLLEPDTRISLSVTRQQLDTDRFEENLQRLQGPGGVPAGRLELRLAERTVAALQEPKRRLDPMAGTGAALVVAEYGRAFSSLARLAELPLEGLQLDRRIVSRLGLDPTAMAVCVAVRGVAHAFGLRASAAGADSPTTLASLQRAGFEEAAGGCFGEIEPARPEAGSDEQRS